MYMLKTFRYLLGGPNCGVSGSVSSPATPPLPGLLLPKKTKAKTNVPIIVIQVHTKFHIHVQTPGPEELQNL